MQINWERRRILIWGKTRPEVSKTYRETVCTGGIFEDTGRMVRLYPIPLRYLDESTVFQKYQWIEADVARSADRDPRPESFRIRFKGITVGGKIGTSKGTWSERAEWVLQPSNIFQSVEALQAKQRENRTSLGIVTPKEIVEVHRELYTPRERDEFWWKYKEAVAQLEMEFDDDEQPTRPLPPPDYRFFLRFRCDDLGCHYIHKFSILDWELDALYFNMKRKYGEEQAALKVTDDVEKKLRHTTGNTRLFLGNTAAHPQNFSVVGLWYPTKVQSPRLFDGE